MGELALLTARSPGAFAEGYTHDMFVEARYMCVSRLASLESVENERLITTIDNRRRPGSPAYTAQQPGMENNPLVNAKENAQRPDSRHIC